MCIFFPIFFSCVAPLLKFYGFVCSNFGPLRFYSVVLLTCLEQQLFPIQTFFFKGIPIRHISGESENLELEALEALEAPVARNRQDHLKWLLGAFQGRTVTGTVTGTENCSAENVNMSAESFGREGQKVVFFFVPLDLKRWT